MKELDYYGEDVDYIHLKFGDARKQYNFTDDFRYLHPVFCAEYEKYWRQDPTCRFEDPLQIVNYVEYYDIPVHFYFNYTDTPAKNNKEVQQYLVRERLPRQYGEWNTKQRKMLGWDGEAEKEDEEEEANVGMDVKSELTSAIVEWVVHNLTTYPLNNPDDETEYSEDVQPIFSAILDIVDEELK